MPGALENPRAHDPALARDHAAGPDRETLSPSERALAPEGDAPMQSHNAIADDGTYVGQGGGYGGGASTAGDRGTAEADESNRRGEGAYGFPSGPGVGVPGGEHQPVAQKPDDLPLQYPQR